MDEGPILRAKLAAHRAEEARERAEEAGERILRLNERIQELEASPAVHHAEHVDDAGSSLRLARDYAAAAHAATADAFERLATLHEQQILSGPLPMAHYRSAAAYARSEAARHRHLAQPEQTQAFSDTLTISSHHDGDAAVIAVHGEIDGRTSPHLRGLLASHTDCGCVHLVLDTSGLKFCDSSGLQVLLNGQRDARTGGGWLRLAAIPMVLRRVLDVTRLIGVFPIYADVSEALHEH